MENGSQKISSLRSELIGSDEGEGGGGGEGEVHEPATAKTCGELPMAARVTERCEGAGKRALSPTPNLTDDGWTVEPTRDRIGL